jgi:hypothetical protein
MEGDRAQAPPLWIFWMIRMKLKKTELPNLVIRVTQITKYLVIWLFGVPKEPNIWLFSYLGDPNDWIWQFGSSEEDQRNQIWQ